MDILTFISDNLLWLGLILLSPTLYGLTRMLVIWLAIKFGKKKDIIIRHYHDDVLISETIVKADLAETLRIRKMAKKGAK